MGQKYSINSAGRIVAERDIYSLGGFIPKGRLGGFIADETQLSQEGECWLAGGNISTRPDVRIKDNAYIGDFFANEQAVHTDGITEFSGNTLIPGYITIRSFASDTKNNVFVKDSFIGVSMDVLCGPASTTTAFPFEQGGFNKDVPKGTLFTSTSMRLDDTSACRNTATLRLGRNTYLYIPTGYRARVYWAYYDKSNQLAYSGESTAIQAGLIKLNHSVYRLAMVSIAKTDGTAMTPANLLATGAKILGHIGGSLLQDLRPESASGEYTMANSSFIAETDNFGLATTQLRFLAGGMYDTTMFTKTDRPDYKLYGTFRNVERLEYTKYLGDSHRTAVTRDTYISAYDCPLLRVDNDTYDSNLINAGGVTLRNCIVPKASFVHDAVNGNTYEGIDFSYANEFVRANTDSGNIMVSSHSQGLYSALTYGRPTALISYPGNLGRGSSISEELKFVPLDGDIIEQGSYTTGPGKYYKDSRIADPNRVRTTKPIATFGIVFPSLPTGFSVKAAYYLDDGFILRSTVLEPSTIKQTYPYVVMTFRHNDDSAITASDFIALNLSLTFSEYTKTPEITGSAYVGAGCTVRGDVQLHGDPYVNRVFDVNEWDRGGLNTAPGLTWDVMKDGRNSDVRMTTKSIYPVSPGDTISVSGAYKILLCWFNEDRKLMSDTGWNNRTLTVPANVYYVGIALATNPDLKFLDFSDIPLANVMYLRAFKKRRYITNELDRVSPEDILLGPGFFEQGGISIAEGNAGNLYEELKIASPYRIRLKRPFGLGAGYRVTFSSVYSFGTSYYDAVTKLLYGSTSANMNNALFALVGSIAGSPTATITPADVTAARVVIEFTPTPRIIVPYGSDTLFISGPKIRMYDNAVLSRNLNQEGEIVLQGDTVMGYDFNSGDCMCSNGHDDAIITKP